MMLGKRELQLRQREEQLRMRELQVRQWEDQLFEWDRNLTKGAAELKEIFQRLVSLYAQYAGHLLEQLRPKVADGESAKYNDDQPRDPNGRWTCVDGSGMDIDKAVEALDKNALKSPSNNCAVYVRWAIQAGGVPLKKPYPVSAKKYGGYLESYGFKKVSPTPPPDYKPQKGDIVVFQPPKYPDKFPYNEPDYNQHKDGHIEMYNGKDWVSDCTQPWGFWPHHDYRDLKATYTIYRP